MAADKVLDLQVWGKQRGLSAPYPLIWHLVDAAAASTGLWDSYLAPSQRAVIAAGLGLSEPDAKKVVAFLAGLHDLGKCTADFQRQHKPSFDNLLRDGYEDPTWDSRLGHARASQLLAYPLLCALGYGEGSRPKRTPAYLAAGVLDGHHGRFQPNPPLDYLLNPVGRVPQLAGEAWRSQRELIADRLRAVVGDLPVPTKAEPSAFALVTGIVILADWLVSQESFLHARAAQAGANADHAAVAVHFAATLESVPALLSDAGLDRSALRGGVFDEMFPFPPNALQRSLILELVPEVRGPGLLVIAAAPGEGKTEAALYAAQRLATAAGAHGCFFALPTMATSDQMYRRVRGFLGKQAVEATSLTLLHSMAWLNPEYTDVRPETDTTEVVSDEGATGHRGRVAATAWLRSGKRGLLADWATGTIDQALLAMLPVPHNTLRLLGISRKVLVVDEAHAYDAYMQFLLRRLLTWCGRLRTPVVLLSATLPSSVSTSLAQAYLRGADHTDGARGDLQVPYPGWLFVPADGSPAIAPGSSARTSMAASRPVDLTVRVLPVRHETTDGDPLPGSRRAALAETLAVIGTAGGCAAVICNTVADAQGTFADLKGWARQQPTRPQVYLLHARFPAWQRQQITETVTTLFGKQAGLNAGDASHTGPTRPPAAIVVATQVIEQSLDLDFDIVVSDLAPMALLLQRAGRCQRHPLPQCKRAAAHPLLVVLDPVDGDGRHIRPRHWGEVYDRYLLRSTRDLLLARGTPMIQVPGEVQDLVEQVYCPDPAVGMSFLTDDERQLREWDEHEGRRLAEQELAALAAIKEPAMLGDLSALSNTDITDDRPPTRLGADSRRLVPCYVRDDGSRWLDREATTTPLPEQPAGPRFSPAELALIMQHTVPVRQSQVSKPGASHQPPDAWQEHFLLADLLLLPHTPAAANLLPQPIGDLPFQLDPDLGLLKH